VAQPERPNGGGAAHGAHVDGQRVAVVDQPCRRRELLDVAGDRHQLGRVAQRTQHPARSDGVTHGLLHSMLRRDVEVRPPAGRGAYGDGHHHEGRAGQRAPTVGGGGHPHLRSGCLGHSVAELRHRLRGVRVQVHEPDVVTVRERRVRQVAQQAGREHCAACPDEHEDDIGALGRAGVSRMTTVYFTLPLSSPLTM
jgi:hypothetical protein